jgi:hypothetical protein
MELEFVVVEFHDFLVEGGTPPHENGWLSKERGCEKGIA